MPEYQRVLAPTDFSGFATDAVHAAAGLAHQYKAELHLLHILLGSTAERVVHEATCDVLVIKPEKSHRHP